ncbi:hypothetical protein C2G38_2240455 [Gigaspora rosea]|uniref:Uncharacterized protein n=1 Tax=Gigaspora rosea TaxID=44941 RepID=A0A397W0Z2_9GLOM|nr:hypothetical protein C2G38_2240455 [Gigaspora rosea]
MHLREILKNLAKKELAYKTLLDKQNAQIKELLEESGETIEQDVTVIDSFLIINSDNNDQVYDNNDQVYENNDQV